MIDILLMVVIGGMGTMYGAVLGATLFVLAQNYLQDLMARAADATAALPLLPRCSIRIAGCCGSACCSCSASIFPQRHRRQLAPRRARGALTPVLGGAGVAPV